MTQAVRAGRVLKICGWAVLGLAAAALQGLAVFWFGEFDGAVLSRTGLACVLAPAGVELVLFVVVMKNLDELHGRAVANPHSPLGQALRNDRDHPPAPPPTRTAWDGGFEDMNQAASKMAKDR